MPETRVRDGLHSLIAGLAREYGSVPFEPHVTLLGGIHGTAPPAAPLLSLAARLTAMTVRFGDMQYRPEYFRCLYIPVKPDADLHRAHDLARSLFDAASSGPFEPHISLLYGDMPEELKRAVAARVSDQVPRAVRLERLALYDLSGAPDAWSAVYSRTLQGNHE